MNEISILLRKNIQDDKNEASPSLCFVLTINLNLKKHFSHYYLPLPLIQISLHVNFITMG